MGIETAGVKDIAGAKNKEDLIFNASVIHRGIFLLAILGTIVCILCCYPISIWAFDSDGYTFQIGLLSICIFFSIMTAGEMLLLQGMHKVSYIVKSTIVWNILSLVVVIPLYYLFRLNGIVIGFIVISIITYLSTRYFRMKTRLNLQSVSLHIIVKKGKQIIQIGIFILLTTIQTQLTLFVIKSFTIDLAGLTALGLVQASWTISNVYISLILAAMSSDYYPRLGACIDNNTKVRKLVNEQILFILLVSTPIVIALLSSSKLVLTLLYSHIFANADNLLNWILLGSFIKAISWAFGFILICKNRGFLFLSADLLFSFIYLIISYYYLSILGIEAIGIGYVIAYSCYLLVVYILSYRISNFRWKSFNMKIGFGCLVLIFLCFYINLHKTDYHIVISIILFIISCSYSIYEINKIIPLTSIYKRFKNK